MPGNQTEVAIQVRQFNGVDIQTDPAFLPEDVLQASQNLVPQFTYLLQKRYGTAVAPNLSLPLSGDGKTWASPRVDIIRWSQRTGGTNLLFFVVTTTGDGVTTASGDRLYAAVGSPSPTVTSIHTFATSGGRYGMAFLGGNLYVSNGVEPIVVVVMETLAVSSLGTIGSFAMANTATVVPATGNSSGLLTGLYSYRWASLDLTTPAISQWVTMGPTGTIQVNAAVPSGIQFTGPTGGELTVDANHPAHLFISPPGLPIEYARDAGTVTTNAGPPTLTVTSFPLTADLTPLRGASQTGRYLLRHLARIWVSGDQTASGINASKLYATGTIVPGLEQQIYNYGDFFPALANEPVGGFDGDVVTGLAISGGGANKDVQSAPVVITKNAATYLWSGDILDDDNAQLTQVSDRFGCVAPQTLVSTSDGVFFLGVDSVYYLAPGFTEPQDIGLPIRPAILGIPTARIAFATATFHRGYYKLAITPPGGIQNTVQWWLDLRPSTGPDNLIKNGKWWGPHQCTPTSTMTVGTLDPAERERLYIGREIPPSESPPIVQICIADQQGLYYDAVSTTQIPSGLVPVTARLRTGGLVENDPFGWKDWNLVRVVTRPDSDTPITVTTYTDGGAAMANPTMNQNIELDAQNLPNSVVLAQSGAAIWDVSLWDVGTWGQRLFVEGWSIFAPPFRAHSMEVELTHASPVGLLVRDLEARYEPIARRAPGAR